MTVVHSCTYHYQYWVGRTPVCLHYICLLYSPVLWKLCKAPQKQKNSFCNLKKVWQSTKTYDFTFKTKRLPGHNQMHGMTFVTSKLRHYRQTWLTCCSGRSLCCSWCWRVLAVSCCFGTGSCCRCRRVQWRGYRCRTGWWGSRRAAASVSLAWLSVW